VLVVVVVGVSAVMYFRSRNQKVSADKLAGKSTNTAGDGAVQSEVELNPQFHIENLDHDIFASRKRPLKVNEDESVVTKYYDTSVQLNSNTKMTNNGLDASSKKNINGGDSKMYAIGGGRLD